MIQLGTIGDEWRRDRRPPARTSRAGLTWAGRGALVALAILAGAAALAQTVDPAGVQPAKPAPGQSDPKSPAAAPSIRADAATQSLIAAVADAPDDDSRRLALERIESAHTPPSDDMIRQLVVFAAGAKGTRAAMTPAVIFRRLDVTEEARVRALIPLLDSPDAAIVSAARGVLSGVERRSASRRADFAAYLEPIAERVRSGGAVPDGLVRHLYEVDAGAAMLLMMRAHQWREPAAIRELLWAEHVLSGTLWKQQHGFLRPDEVEDAAMVELRRMAAHGEWWVRLYASELMRAHRAFVQADLPGALAADANALVRESAAAALQTNAAGRSRD
ncbi:MAG: hypothetical protein HRU75_13625 [Planctomycetia bacterium]|nr:MAG: hypothetical protein HRU75_13625 [Planctomycetia bacterium]